MENAAKNQELNYTAPTMEVMTDGGDAPSGSGISVGKKPGTTSTYTVTAYIPRDSGWTIKSIMMDSLGRGNANLTVLPSNADPITNTHLSVDFLLNPRSNYKCTLVLEKGAVTAEQKSLIKSDRL